MIGGNQVGALGAWSALLEDPEADSWVVLTDVPWLSSERVLLVVLCIVPAKSLNLVEAAIQEFVAEMLEVDLQGC